MFFVLALNQVIDRTRNLENNLQQKTLTEWNPRLIIAIIDLSFTVLFTCRYLSVFYTEDIYLVAASAEEHICLTPKQ